LPVAAQNEAALNRYFEGKVAVVRADLPAAPQGVNIEVKQRAGARGLNHSKYAKSLNKFGTAVGEGQYAQIRELRVFKKHIEVYVVPSPATAQHERARVNLRYDDLLPAAAVTPDGVMKALLKVVEFPDETERLQAASSYGALRVGMKKASVDRLIGAPSICSGTKRDGLAILDCRYNLTAVRITASFVAKVLDNYSTEPRND
jgi:hypothetical protein